MCFGEHHGSLSVCEFKKFPALHETRVGAKESVGGGEYLGQIVEHADPLCRHTHVRILSLSADKTTCMFINSRDRGL